MGSGAALTIIDANGIDRAFDVPTGASLTIADLTIRNGGNTPEGGAIRSAGSLTLQRTVLETNSANNGGAILSQGPLLVEDSSFRQNQATYGGALYHGGNTATVTRSTFADNHADANSGGALYSVEGTLALVNVTVSGNTAGKSGGGLATGTGTGPVVSIVSSTFAGNASPTGGAIRVWRGSVTLQNTIVAYSPSGDNCSQHPQSFLLSAGYNLTSDSTCQPVGPGDQSGVDPLLGPLQDNGGPTATHQPLPGSPAIDAGTCDGVPPSTSAGSPGRKAPPVISVP